MIDERQEELASLYALDLLEGAERAQFETALARDPVLQALVRELRETSANLAHIAPTNEVPAALKTRLLASIDQSAAPQPAGNVVRGPWSLVLRPVLAWSAAACFALLAGWFGQLYFTAGAEAQLLRTQQTLGDLALKSARNQLEAEQLLAQHQVADLNRQLSTATEKMAASDRDTRTAAEREAQLRRDLATAATHATEVERLLAGAREQLATLDRDFKAQTDLANFKIATLASMLNNAPQALAVAVWNPQKQEGVFTLEKMPPPPAGQTLELWVIEDKKAPVSAGIFNVTAEGKARATFKPASPVGVIAKFAVSREKSDGLSAHPVPTEVVMISQ
jgi:anti-sigma-K factor RskA